MSNRPFEIEFYDYRQLIRFMPIERERQFTFQDFWVANRTFKMLADAGYYVSVDLRPNGTSTLKLRQFFRPQ